MDASSSTTYTAMYSSCQNAVSLVEHDACVESCITLDKDVHNPEDTEKGEFTYSSLDLKSQSIRLIQLVPELSSNGYIQCNIRDSSIDDTYTCLSYEWGEKNPSHTIGIGDALFPVRKNLWDFLDVARRRHHTRWLWIDALCINQSNIKERSHQVQQMGRIYEQAQEVFSWLGTDASISNFLTKAPQQPRGGPTKGYRRLIRSNYWKRAWVTQEIALARHVTVMACDSELDLPPARRHLQRHTQRHTNRDWGHPDPARWNTYRGRSLICLLYNFSNKECEEYQDKVYSLMALCKEGWTLRVDYKLTRQQLAVQVLKRCERMFCFCSFTIVARALELDMIEVQKSALDKTTESSSLSAAFAQLSVPVKRQYGITESMEVVLHGDEVCGAIPGSVTVQVSSGHEYSQAEDREQSSHVSQRKVLDANDLSWYYNGKKLVILGDQVAAYLSEDCSFLTITFPFAALLRFSRFYHRRELPCTRVKSLESDQSLEPIFKIL